MGRGIFNRLLNNLESAGDRLVDKRREGFDLKYKLTDVLKSALSVFFFQHPCHAGFPEQNEAEIKTQQSGNDNGGKGNTKQRTDNDIA
jgi:hypothetical protein